MLVPFCGIKRGLAPQAAGRSHAVFFDHGFIVHTHHIDGVLRRRGVAEPTRRIKQKNDKNQKEPSLFFHDFIPFYFCLFFHHNARINSVQVKKTGKRGNFILLPALYEKTPVRISRTGALAPIFYKLTHQFDGDDFKILYRQLKFSAVKFQLFLVFLHQIAEVRLLKIKAKGQGRTGFLVIAVV